MPRLCLKLNYEIAVFNDRESSMKNDFYKLKESHVRMATLKTIPFKLKLLMPLPHNSEIAFAQSTRIFL